MVDGAALNKYTYTSAGFLYTEGGPVFLKIRLTIPGTCLEHYW
jgi:hypothetical protein